MSWLTRVANVFRTRKLSAELDDELRFHIAERTDDLIASGMTEAEARSEAVRNFGNYAAQKEWIRDMDIAGWLEAFLRDLRYGARQVLSKRARMSRMRSRRNLPHLAACFSP